MTMFTIHKAMLPLADRHEIEIPEDAEILSIGVQGSSPDISIWYRTLDPSKITMRVFYVRGTGHFMHDGAKYIGTVQMAGGHLVWHVFGEPDE